MVKVVAVDVGCTHRTLKRPQATGASGLGAFPRRTANQFHKESLRNTKGNHEVIHGN
jgi:hypothetical protein